MTIVPAFRLRSEQALVGILGSPAETLDSPVRIPAFAGMFIRPQRTLGHENEPGRPFSGEWRCHDSPPKFKLTDY
jgi:hypothetical protein